MAIDRINRMAIDRINRMTTINYLENKITTLIFILVIIIITSGNLYIVICFNKRFASMPVRHTKYGNLKDQV